MPAWLQFIIDRLAGFGVQLANIGGWFLAIFTSPMAVIIYLIGAILLIKAWRQGKEFASLGSIILALKVLAVALVFALIFLGLFWVVARYSGTYGRSIVQGFADGFTESMTPVPPPGSGPVSQPSIFATSTPGAPGQAAAVPQTFAGGCYKITDPTGATARTEANSTSALAGDGSIDTGLTVKVDQTVDSNNVGGVSKRARLAEAAGGVPAGAWFHLSAATSVACP